LIPSPEFEPLSPDSEEAIVLMCSQAEASIVQGDYMNDHRL
jgi:hypothetical protein